jgi:hypothetical protein
VYLYDFFYDNCSSIIRDVLDSTLYGGVTYADLSEADNPSFRNLIDRNLIYHPWGDFGIDLGLGMPCDKKPTYLEYMFLPDKLNEALDEAEFRGRPLVKVERTILEGKPLELNRSMTDPLPLFWILFGVIATLSAWGYRKGKRQIALDYTLLTFYGLVGALLFFLWFITDHTATSNNLNVLWAWPIHLLALPFLHIQKFRKLYFTAYTGVLVVTLLTFPLLPQMLHIATIPLMLTMVVRGFINWKLDQLLPRFKSISEQPPKKIGF